MKFVITVAETAELDMYDIYTYVELYDSPERSDRLFEGIRQAIASLAHMPERGHYPPELNKIRVRDFREIHFKPYRIVYSLLGHEVTVHCVLDGRRDMQTLLQQRLLH